MRDLASDIRYGLRVLAGVPGFTAVALISLSLGIAIATCAYSELHGLILRDVPGVAHPSELVALQTPASYPNYQRYRTPHDLFSSTAAYLAPVPFSVALGGARAERTWGHLVTPSYFATLGVHPALGRFFRPEHEQPGQAPAVVLSYRFWQERLGGDRAVIGRAVRINGQPCTVIGVASKDFLGASPALFAAELWVPVSAGGQVAPELAGNALERRDLNMFQMLGRLQPGVSEERAEAVLDAVARKVEQDYGDPDRNRAGRRVLLLPAGKILPIRKQDRPFFTEFLLVLAGLVLLITCATVANMALARAADRRREIAVRLSLGASRARLVRQLLTENMLLAAGAGVPGFLLAAWLMRLLSKLRMPVPIPVSFDLRPDWRALLFALAATLLTGLAFGLAPAWQATRTDLTPALKEGGHMQLRRYRRLSLRNALVLCQMATSLMLLLLTGYMGLGIQSTMGIQEGFNPRNLYLLSLDPVRDGYSGAQAAAFFEKLLDRVQRLPAVAAACLTDTVPVAIDGNAGVTFSAADGKLHDARRHMVGKDYFETTGIPILLGRSFRRQDEADGARTVVVSEELVRKYWRAGNPLGRRLEIRNGEVSPGLGAMPGTLDFRAGVLGDQRQTFEVVGVAKDVAEDLVVSKKHPVIYFPLHAADYAQPSLRGMTLMVRAAPGVDAIGLVRREVATLDAGLTPFTARSMTEQIDQFMSALRAASWSYGLIGVFGLILASVGLAGVTAYAVAQRGHEIAIRMALGAQSGDVLGLVMREGAALVAAGTIIGLAAAWVGMRALSGLFFSVASVRSSDSGLLLGAPLLLAGLALAACYLPARRSARIDPAAVLRRDV